MYEYIKGTLIDATPAKVVVETAGLGFSLLIPFSHFSLLPQQGSTITLFVSFVVREDAHRLFGFLTSQARDLFEKLIEISGIGPKTALCLIGHIHSDELQATIQSSNVARLCKIPGIGKKTAERLIVEMRDKFGKLDKQQSGSIPLETMQDGVVADALAALINLGYNDTQAQKAIKTVLSKGNTKPQFVELITLSLRHI